jgi:AraC-like DNA-binding protein
VKYYWILKTRESLNKVIQTIPSGCVHLAFHRGGDLYFSNGEKQPANFVRGQLSVPGQLSGSGDLDMIAVIFYPLGMTPFLFCPAHELYNQYIDIESSGDQGLKELKDFISNEADTLLCVRQIERFLFNRLCDFSDYNYHRILSSIRQIIEQDKVNVSDLADHACLGYRHFKRIFTGYVGVDPKEYIKVIRFQRTLYTLQNHPDMDITQLAYACGFYDHSHLVKDFRSLSGCSPTEYLSSRRPYSTFFSRDCKINLIRKSG